jgi:hypothetical protein
MEKKEIKTLEKKLEEKEEVLKQVEILYHQTLGQIQLLKQIIKENGNS